jgi:hypothetical protein
VGIANAGKGIGFLGEIFFGRISTLKYIVHMCSCFYWRVETALLNQLKQSRRARSRHHTHTHGLWASLHWLKCRDLANVPPFANGAIGTKIGVPQAVWYKGVHYTWNVMLLE